MKAQILHQTVDFVIINTDGWVTGDIAVRYKTALIKELKPDLIVGLPQENELAALIANIEETPVIVVEPSSSLSPRNPEKRKILREMTYARYLKDAKMQCYPISQLTIEPKKCHSEESRARKRIACWAVRFKKQILRNWCPERN